MLSARAPALLSHYSRTKKSCPGAAPNPRLAGCCVCCASIWSVSAGGGLRPHLLDLHKLGQELIQAVDQLDAPLSFNASLQQFLQRLEFQRKLACHPVRQKSVDLVVHIDIAGWAAVQQQVAIGEKSQQLRRFSRRARL